MIFVFHGKINSGKSTSILKLYGELKTLGIDVGGWITPPYIENGVKVGQNIILLNGKKSSFKSIPFMRRTPFEDSFEWRNIHFNGKAFNLAKSISFEHNIFIMDEIGPLEIIDGKGFLKIMKNAIAKTDRSIIVVRQSILATFLETISMNDFSTYDTESVTDMKKNIAASLTHRSIGYNSSR